MSITALILWALLALLLLVLLTAATRPDHFRVERVLLMSAPAATVHAAINDFRAWAAWSPWEKIDPTMQRTYSGEVSGKGAVYAWSGNGKAGAGRMEILESVPERITIRIDFFKPFAASNTVEFTLAAEGNGTRVSWAMYGPSPYISKLMGLAFNLDKMIGRDFEAGLANMRAVTESQR